MPSANSDNLYSSLPIWMPLFLFGMIAMARISSTMLNESFEGEYPCLVSDLRGKAFYVLQ